MSFWEKVKLVLSSIFAWFEPTIRDFASRAGQTVLETAYASVVLAAQQKAEGTFKFEIAKQDLLDRMKSKGFELGVDFTTSMINRAIELSLSKAKADGAIAR
jgi:hypothetical protein